MTAANTCLLYTSQTIVDEVQESEHQTALFDHVEVSATDGELIGVQTVSYTHLDVYKRQSATC